LLKYSGEPKLTITLDYPMDELPPEFWQGVDQFNQQQFYACHDTLEALWIEASEPEKQFYQGILQIAVALYHLGNLNWNGAVILLGEGLYRLRHYSPDYGGIDLVPFLEEARAVLDWLQATGPTQVVEVSQQLLAAPVLTALALPPAVPEKSPLSAPLAPTLRQFSPRDRP
jgi:uncharacterized protein